MNCPKCNAANAPDARFCGSCGYDLSQAAPVNTETEEILEVEEPVMQTPQTEEQPVMMSETPVMEQPVPQEQQMMNNMANNMAQQPMMNNMMPEQMPNNQQPMNNQPMMNMNMNNITPQTQPGLNPMSQQPKKSKMGLIFGIIGGLVLLAVIIVVVLNLPPSEEKQEKAKIDALFNPNQLIRVKKDDKYGYIDTDGKFQIQPIYETATDFRGDYAVVRLETEVEGITKSVYQIIDNKGKVKRQADRNIEYVEETESWIIDDELYNKSMKKISPANVRVDHEDDNYYVWVNSKENTGGIMNEKGKITYTYSFQEDETSIYITVPSIDETQTERYCLVNVNNKYGIVNCSTGTEIYPMTDNVRISGSDNIFTVKQRGTYDFIEIMYVQNDKKMYSSNSEDIDLYYYPGYVTIRDGSKSYDERYKYLHTATGEIKDDQPSVSDEEDDEATLLDPWEKYTKTKKFSCSTGYGLMNDDQVTLPCEWDRLSYVDLELYKYLKSNKKDYIFGEKQDKWYLIDIKTKKGIVEFNASYIYPQEDSTFMYYTDRETSNKKAFNLLSNKSLSIDSGKTLTIYSNYITVKDKTAGKLKYYNTDMTMIYEEIL